MSDHLSLFQCDNCGRYQGLNPQLGRYQAENKARRVLREKCKKANCRGKPHLLTGWAAIMARTAMEIVAKLPEIKVPTMQGWIVDEAVEFGDQG